MIAGVVLAAGKSSRMGSPKLTLPWGGGQTVIGSVVAALHDGGVERIVVVVGGDREAVETALAGAGVEFSFNPDYEHGEMLSSVQAGLRALGPEVAAAMLAPGDLPDLRADTVERVRSAWEADRLHVCAPIHGSRRGHPLMIPRRFWPELLALGQGESLRTFLHRQADVTRVPVEDPGIHADLDTPDDYRRSRREG